MVSPAPLPGCILSLVHNRINKSVCILNHKFATNEISSLMSPDKRAKRPAPSASDASSTHAAGGRRLPRAERRDQILAAATRAFARAGFAATSLDDIAAEAGISRVILYRHFESKTDLYRAVLDRVRARLTAAV